LTAIIIDDGYADRSRILIKTHAGDSIYTHGEKPQKNFNKRTAIN
jgi:hypothetical protein